MNGFRSQRIGSESGYTLIELLAVMSILLILSLFSVPVMDTLTDKARLATSLQDMRVIEQALEAYHARNGQYPDRLGVLTTEGYLSNDFTFKSPWASEDEKDGKQRFFFYAVDDEDFPTAYILGDPGPNPECTNSRSTANPAELSNEKGSSIPCGTKPDSVAREFAKHLKLNPLPVWEKDSRQTLSGWRNTCDPKSPAKTERAAWCVIKTES